MYKRALTNQDFESRRPKKQLFSSIHFIKEIVIPMLKQPKNTISFLLSKPIMELESNRRARIEPIRQQTYLSAYPIYSLES